MIRQLRYNEIETASKLGDKIYPDFHESLACFQSKFNIYPQGCFGYFENNKLVGYAIGHPWNNTPVLLNSTLYNLPSNPGFFYIHDVAVTPEFRKKNFGRELVETLFEEGIRSKFTKFSLIAVNDSELFWRAFGFIPNGDVQYGKVKALKMQYEL